MHGSLIIQHVVLRVTMVFKTVILDIRYCVLTLTFHLHKATFRRQNLYFCIITTQKMELQAVRCRGMDWIELAQDMERWRALANAVMNLRVP